MVNNSCTFSKCGIGVQMLLQGQCVYKYADKRWYLHAQKKKSLCYPSLKGSDENRLNFHAL